MERWLQRLEDSGKSGKVLDAYGVALETAADLARERDAAITAALLLQGRDTTDQAKQEFLDMLRRTIREATKEN